ncbi:hypothetical protein P152DRAFT_313678 [Eremomyces bilateralis CBS 781.70]|uniref:Uncharacterized protein n=1 Tax=Eremomyces bilateralis CBS 781.70 TaxID=1392243 RepID=A0A6G1G5H1_9PEZI|nr:uncharacterized protein P152DRAFT_313678 [Eremomyces bilateralis CBS 781.70]KAF1813304.1 hypothetical protein P152DRAFT_313678 [Eremomyces bilateralis CBS 781.70]
MSKNSKTLKDSMHNPANSKVKVETCTDAQALDASDPVFAPSSMIEWSPPAPLHPKAIPGARNSVKTPMTMEQEVKWLKLQVEQMQAKLTKSIAGLRDEVVDYKAKGNSPSSPMAVEQEVKWLKLQSEQLHTKLTKGIDSVRNDLEDVKSKRNLQSSPMVIEQEVRGLKLQVEQMHTTLSKGITSMRSDLEDVKARLEKVNTATVQADHMTNGYVVVKADKSEAGLIKTPAIINTNGPMNGQANGPVKMVNGVKGVYNSHLSL